MRRKFALGFIGSAVLSIALAGSAMAAPGGNKAGDSLVNVQVSGITILVPVAVAANLCDINVNALADQVDAGDTTCTATADSAASPGWNSGGGGNQAGNTLVNVQIADVFVAVPISLAANLCDINVNVLAGQLRLGDATCKASGIAVVPTT